MKTHPKVAKLILQIKLVKNRKQKLMESTLEKIKQLSKVK